MRRALGIAAASALLAMILACGLNNSDTPPPIPAPPPPVVPVAEADKPPDALPAPLEEGWPRTVRFGEQVFYLSYRSDDGRTAVAEYLLRGQRPSQWLEMMAIRQYRNEQDPMQLAERMNDALHEKRPPRPSELWRARDGSQRAALDFVDFQGEIVEANAWRFESTPTGVLAYQYARRSYDRASAEAMTAEVGTARAVRNLFLNAEFPPAGAAHAGPFERYYTRSGDANGEVLLE